MAQDPWTIKVSDFPKNGAIRQKLEYFIGYGVLAPSSHNTQPWTFSIRQNAIAVMADMSRRLPVADPRNRELMISLGCAIANIEIAARYFFHEPHTTLFPQGGTTIANISIRPTEKKPITLAVRLFRSIPKRRTNRALYIPKKHIPRDVQQELCALAVQEGITLRYTEKSDVIKKLGTLTQVGMETVLRQPKFRQEIALWLRHNFTKKLDGMPGYTIGMSDPVSLTSQTMIRSPEIGKYVGKGEKIAIESSPAIGVLCIPKDTPEYWLRTGMAFERLALFATSHHIATAILSASVEVASQREKLRILLKEQNFPSLFFRLGYPTAPVRHAPRRPVSDVVVERNAE